MLEVALRNAAWIVAWTIGEGMLKNRRVEFRDKSTTGVEREFRRLRRQEVRAVSWCPE